MTRTRITDVSAAECVPSKSERTPQRMTTKVTETHVANAPTAACIPSKSERTPRRMTTRVTETHVANVLTAESVPSKSERTPGWIGTCWMPSRTSWVCRATVITRHLADRQWRSLSIRGAEVVAPPSFAASYGRRPSTGSRNGARYRTASWTLVANQGEKRITMRTEAGDTGAMAFQVADVTKPLAWAGRITSNGHRIVLADEDSYIQHKATGRKIRLHKKNNVFVMRMQIVPPDVATNKNNTKDNAQVLGKLGVTRQED